MSTTNLKLQVLMAGADKLSAPIRRIRGETVATATTVKKLRGEVSELNAKQRQIDGYRKTAEQTAKTGHAVKAAQERIAQLSQEMAKATTPSRQLQKALEGAKREASDLTKQHHELIAKQQRMRTALAASGIETRKLGEHQRRLKTDTAEAVRALAAEEQKLTQINAKLRQQHAIRAKFNNGMNARNQIGGAGASMLVGGAAVGAPIVGMIKNYADFETAMLGVAKQVDEARKDTGELSDTYYEMARAIQAMSEVPGSKSAIELAALVEAAARNGIKGKANLLAFAATANTSAVAFDMAAEEIGDSLSKISNLYKLPIANIEELGDTINWLDDKTHSKGADIIDVMQRIAGMADKLDYRNAAALGSTFLTLGASAEVAASASEAMVRELTNATIQPKRFQDGLAALKLNAKDVQKGMAKDATNTILRVLDAIQLLPAELQTNVTTQLFGKEYGDDAAKLANNLKEYRKQIDLVHSAKARGSMKKEASAQADTLNARWAAIKNRTFNTGANLGKTLKPELIELMGYTNRLLGGINAWVRANPALAGTLMKVGAALAVLLVAMGGITLALAAFMGPMLIVRAGMAMMGVHVGGAVGLLSKLGGVLGMLGKAMMWLGRIFLLNPIGLVVTAIALAAYLIWKHWDVIGPKFAALWAGIKRVFATALSAITNFIMNWTVVGFIVDHWQDLKAITLAVWALIKRGITAIANGLTSYFMNWTLYGVIARHWDTISGTASRAWQAIKGHAIGAGQAIQGYFLNWTLLGLFVREWGRITGYLASLRTVMASLGGMLVDGIVNGFVGGLHKLKAAINGAGESMILTLKQKLGIRSPSRVFAALGGHTVDGLTVGINKAQHGPLDAMARITKQLTRPIGAAVALGASAMAPASTLNIDKRPTLASQAAPARSIVIEAINVHAAPGMDAQALSRMVAEEVAKALRKATATSTRSRLHDKD
ncbi:phage tail tape measure protein [Chitinimonas prasina]|uniref:Phage tail tape measure protein n=1 Tax=Chitinimonas prasina TaxID=1434937 RepID=A0ABQ5YGZ4_9NEIS|nr:phage tail tape measure protein [Chitinimonas prasina]GLR13278.1 phage tail tape measure protein [Chitinimonas prasina]